MIAIIGNDSISVHVLNYRMICKVQTFIHIEINTKIKAQFSWWGLSMPGVVFQTGSSILTITGRLVRV